MEGYRQVETLLHDMHEHVHLGGELRAVRLKVPVGHVDGGLGLAPHLLHEVLVLVLDPLHLQGGIQIASAALMNCSPLHCSFAKPD